MSHNEVSIPASTDVSHNSSTSVNPNGDAQEGVKERVVVGSFEGSDEEFKELMLLCFSELKLRKEKLSDHLGLDDVEEGGISTSTSKKREAKFTLSLGKEESGKTGCCIIVSLDRDSNVTLQLKKSEGDTPLSVWGDRAKNFLNYSKRQRNKWQDATLELCRVIIQKEQANMKRQIEESVTATIADRLDALERENKELNQRLTTIEDERKWREERHNIEIVARLPQIAEGFAPPEFAIPLASTAVPVSKVKEAIFRQVPLLQGKKPENFALNIDGRPLPETQQFRKVSGVMNAFRTQQRIEVFVARTLRPSPLSMDSGIAVVADKKKKKRTMPAKRGSMPSIFVPRTSEPSDAPLSPTSSSARRFTQSSASSASSNSSPESSLESPREGEKRSQSSEEDHGQVARSLPEKSSISLSSSASLSPQAKAALATKIQTQAKFGSFEKCLMCDKTVYFNERIQIGEQILHADCFKCKICAKKLRTANYYCLSGTFYCKQHYDTTIKAPLPVLPAVPLEVKWVKASQSNDSPRKISGFLDSPKEAKDKLRRGSQEREQRPQLQQADQEKSEETEQATSQESEDNLEQDKEESNENVKQASTTEQEKPEGAEKESEQAKEVDMGLEKEKEGEKEKEKEKDAMDQKPKEESEREKDSIDLKSKEPDVHKKEREKEKESEKEREKDKEREKEENDRERRKKRESRERGKDRRDREDSDPQDKERDRREREREKEKDKQREREKERDPLLLDRDDDKRDRERKKDRNKERDREKDRHRENRDRDRKEHDRIRDNKEEERRERSGSGKDDTKRRPRDAEKKEERDTADKTKDESKGRSEKMRRTHSKSSVLRAQVEKEKPKESKEEEKKEHKRTEHKEEEGKKETVVSELKEEDLKDSDKKKARRMGSWVKNMLRASSKEDGESSQELERDKVIEQQEEESSKPKDKDREDKEREREKDRDRDRDRERSKEGRDKERSRDREKEGHSEGDRSSKYRSRSSINIKKGSAPLKSDSSKRQVRPVSRTHLGHGKPTHDLPVRSDRNYTDITEDRKPKKLDEKKQEEELMQRWEAWIKEMKLSSDSPWTSSGLAFSTEKTATKKANPGLYKLKRSSSALSLRRRNFDLLATNNINPMSGEQIPKSASAAVLSVAASEAQQANKTAAKSSEEKSSLFLASASSSSDQRDSGQRRVRERHEEKRRSTERGDRSREKRRSKETSSTDLGDRRRSREITEREKEREREREREKRAKHKEAEKRHSKESENSNNAPSPEKESAKHAEQAKENARRRSKTAETKGLPVCGTFGEARAERLRAATQQYISAAEAGLDKTMSDLPFGAHTKANEDTTTKQEDSDSMSPSTNETEGSANLSQTMSDFNSSDSVAITAGKAVVPTDEIFAQLAEVKSLLNSRDDERLGEEMNGTLEDDLLEALARKSSMEDIFQPLNLEGEDLYLLAKSPHRTEDGHDMLLKLVTHHALTVGQAVLLLLPPIERQKVQPLLIRLFIQTGLDVPLLRLLINKEVQNNEGVILFAQENRVGDLLACHASIIGKPFLAQALGSVIKDVVERNVTVDNTEEVMATCEVILSALYDSTEKIPRAIKELAKELESAMAPQESNKSRVYNILGEYILCRFICPALVSPETFGWHSNPPLSLARREFLHSISTILNNMVARFLAEEQEQTNHEIHTSVFFEVHSKLLSEFFDTFTVQGITEHHTPSKQHAELTKKELEVVKQALHQILYENLEKMERGTTGDSDQHQKNGIAMLETSPVLGELRDCIKNLGRPIDNSNAEELRMLAQEEDELRRKLESWAEEFELSTSGNEQQMLYHSDPMIRLHKDNDHHDDEMNNEKDLLEQGLAALDDLANFEPKMAGGNQQQQEQEPEVGNPLLSATERERREREREEWVRQVEEALKTPKGKQGTLRLKRVPSLGELPVSTPSASIVSPMHGVPLGPDGQPTLGPRRRSETFSCESLPSGSSKSEIAIMGGEKSERGGSMLLFGGKKQTTTDNKEKGKDSRPRPEKWRSAFDFGLVLNRKNKRKDKKEGED